MRGRTIAALRIAQNSRELTRKPMPHALLAFLMTDGALTYWIRSRHWMEKDGPDRVQLTTTGLDVCAASLAGVGPISTSEVIVDQWLHRMLYGDEVAYLVGTFAVEL